MADVTIRHFKAGIWPGSGVGYGEYARGALKRHAAKRGLCHHRHA